MKHQEPVLQLNADNSLVLTMNYNKQIETHLVEITFISQNCDCIAFIKELANDLRDCQLVNINNASDRLQYETSTMFDSSSDVLIEDDIVDNAETRLLIEMIGASPLSTSWFVVSLDDKDGPHKFDKIRDVFKKYYKCMTINWPNFNPQMRWFAIGISLNELEELKLEITNHSCRMFVYWLKSLTNDDSQRVKPLIKLTPREREVLHWVSEGKTSREVSLILNISPKTVNLHADNAINKLNASNRTNAVVRAINLGLL